MFLKSAFRQFSCQSLPELDVFCYSHEEWPNCSLLWKFGLNIPQDGVLVTVFVSHSFSCFNDLKMGNTISMATRMVSFDLVFHKLSENVSFVDLQQGEHGFSSEWGFPVKNLKHMNHLKTLTMVSMETKVVSRDSFLDKLSEKVYLNGFWEG